MSTINTSGYGASSLAPLTQWHDHDHQSHVVQFYAEDAHLLDSIARFVGPALEAGDASVVIATQAHRDGLDLRLVARGIDVAGAIRRGQYIPLDASETLSKFMRDGLPDAGAFADVMGSVLARARAAGKGSDSPRIAAFGEMVALLWAMQNPQAALRLEELWNDLAHTHSFSLRCAYPIAGFDRDEHGESFLKICTAHAGVIPDETYASLPSDDERLRRISQLQQRARALETEKADHELAKGALRKSEADLRLANDKLESLVEQRTSALRQLSSRILTLQDAERRRIARELHDSLGQYLIGLKLNIDMLKRSPGQADLWEQATEIVDQCVTEVRTLSCLLHPPMIDELGLVSSAKWFVEGLGQRSGIEVSLDAPRGLPRLPSAIELVLFRGLQEALTNVHRHSGATAAKVVIRQESDRVVLEVRDNGRGMAPESLARFDQTGAGMGVGLSGMRERVQELGGRMKSETRRDRYFGTDRNSSR